MRGEGENALNCSFSLRAQQIEQWINAVERSIEQTENIDVPLDQYRSFVEKFKVKEENRFVLTIFCSMFRAMLNKLN